MTAVNDRLAALIIFWASESGARLGSRHPSLVLKPTTPTAVEILKDL